MSSSLFAASQRAIENRAGRHAGGVPAADRPQHRREGDESITMAATDLDEREPAPAAGGVRQGVVHVTSPPFAWTWTRFPPLSVTVPVAARAAAMLLSGLPFQSKPTSVADVKVGAHHVHADEVAGPNVRTNGDPSGVGEDLRVGRTGSCRDPRPGRCRFRWPGANTT
jgi:hypothetical protein